MTVQISNIIPKAPMSTRIRVQNPITREGRPVNKQLAGIPSGTPLTLSIQLISLREGSITVKIFHRRAATRDINKKAINTTMAVRV